MFGSNNKIQPFDAADNFFGKPEASATVARNPQSSGYAGVLALKVPPPPQYAPPAVCNISKDGKLVVSGGKDVETYVWDTTHGDLVSTLRGHEVCWTSSHDCSFFVTVQEDSKVVIWDQKEMKQLQTLGHPEEPLVCCSISLDDAYVIVGSAKGSIYSWDSNTGREYRHYEDGHKGPVLTSMCYPMEDGSHVIISCGAADHTIVAWDLQTAEQRVSIHVEELDQAKNVRYCISSDGTQVLAWCTDSVPFPNLVFIDALNNVKNSVYCHEGLIRNAVFGKDSAKIISCGNDGKVMIWDTLSLEPLMSMVGHDGPVLSCCINADGTHIVSSGEDCTVRMWSAEDGRQLQCMQAQDEPVKSVAFDRQTNTKILTVDMAGRLYVWSTLSEVVLNLVRRFSDVISSVCMSADEKLLVSGTNTGSVMMWDVEQRELLWEHMHHAGRVESLAFNSLQELSSAGADGRVTHLSVETGKQINCFVGDDEPFTCVQFSPDDERIAALSADGKIYMFLTNSASRKSKTILRSNIARVTGFVWSPNSKVISGCCSDGCVIIWNAATGSISTVLEGDSPATCCTFDFVGKLLAVGTLMGTTTIYNLETREMLCELSNNSSAVRSIMFSLDTLRLTTICNRQAIVWDVSSNMKIRTYDFVVDKEENGHLFKVKKPNLYRTTVAHSGTVLFDPESETLVFDMVAAEDPTLRSYFLSETRLISCSSNFRGVVVWSATGNSAPDKFHTTHDAITSCHFGFDDRLCAMATQDGNIMIYDVVHNETIEVFAAHHNGPCRCVRLSHDNKEVLSSGADAKVILWDWRTKTPTRIYSGHFVSVGCCDLASEGSRVVSGDTHGMISIWEKDTGHVVQTLPLAHAKAVLSVSISSDGLTIASVGADNKVAIWDVDMGMELVSLTAAIESNPLCCAFSPDGTKLAVTESNGNVMIWSAMVGCQWFMITGAHKGKVTGVSWSADCRRIVTCGDDSVLAVWDSESSAPLHKFPVKSGLLTCVSISPMGLFLAGGSSTGTLSMVNMATSTREIPEPSFLYNWLASKEPQVARLQYMSLAAQYPTLANVQDAQGWSIINHAMSKGNASVASIVLNSVRENSGIFGLISAVPYLVHTSVVFHRNEPSPEEGNFDIREKSVARVMSFFTGKSVTGKGKLQHEGSDASMSGNMRSFSQQVAKKVAVELFTEKRTADHMELILNNALALALNSKSSECVQVLLDAAADNKVSWGSYHAITDMIPSLAARYPYMCYGFLAGLQLQKVGDLEVPVEVISNLDSSVIRTAPFFTNVRTLWQSHLKLHEGKEGSAEAYAHVDANMVRLPFACAIGKESLLQTLVESEVPVKAYSTPTVSAVIAHKWSLYGRRTLTVRALLYLLYTVAFTAYAVIYSSEDRSRSFSESFTTSGNAKGEDILGVYLFLQAAYLAYMELRQLHVLGVALYFESFWNALDLSTAILMMTSIVMQFARVSCLKGQALSPIISFQLILIYFKLLFYALGFEKTGTLVHMVFTIAWAVKDWAILLFLVIVSFTTSLMVLYQYTPPVQGENYSNFGYALLSVWQAGIGTNYSIQNALEYSPWVQVTLIIFSLFLFITQIVLLNMLIALMRDIYTKVQEDERNIFLKGRAELIVEVETLMSKNQIMEYSLMPPYLHMLMPVQRAVHNSSAVIPRLDRLEAMAREAGETLSNINRMYGFERSHPRPGAPGANGAGSSGMAGGMDLSGPSRAISMAGGPSGLPNLVPPPGMMLAQGPNGEMTFVPTAYHPMMDPAHMQNMALQAQQLKESESQLPAILRQIDRLQRTVNNQEMRMEGMVAVLRDIENLLRNQQPVIMTQDRPQPRKGAALSEAELEKEVKRLLGKSGDAGKL